MILVAKRLRLLSVVRVVCMTFFKSIAELAVTISLGNELYDLQNGLQI